MCVFVRIIIITFCLCASPKPFDSIPTPLKIDKLQLDDVKELLMMCGKFMHLKMLDETIYTATSETEIRLTEHVTSADMVHKGTAKIVDYKLPVVNKTLFNLWDDSTFRHLLPEISLRIINVVESVGVFLLIKISLLARWIVGISQTPRILLTTSLLLSLDDIYNKFDELSIPCEPVEDLRKIIRLYTYELDFTSTEMAHFQNACTTFINTYSFLSGFVDIGDVNSTDFNPNTMTMKEFLKDQLEFIRINVDNYFIPIELPTTDEVQ